MGQKWVVLDLSWSTQPNVEWKFVGGGVVGGGRLFFLLLLLSYGLRVLQVLVQ